MLHAFHLRSPNKGPANCSVILYKINHLVIHAYISLIYIPGSEVQETKVDGPLTERQHFLQYRNWFCLSLKANLMLAGPSMTRKFL